MSETLYLIDGHAQIFRAYYAPFGNLSSPSGEPTRATYVFFSMLFKLIMERQPTYWAVALDSPTASASREAVYADYKATRDATPEDLIPQIARITSILEMLEIPVFEMPGYEADDLIASIVERVPHQDLEVYIVSRDKDLEQLIDPRVRLYDPAKDVVITAEALEENKGYRPDQAVEIQSLVGDNVDNIPGITGVGLKTAAKLIAQFGTADAVLEHANELSPKLSQRVTAFADQLPITRKLVTLRRDLEVDLDFDRARFRGLRADRLGAVFDELGFSRLLSTVEKIKRHPDCPDVGDSPPAVERDADVAYEVIDTPEALAKLTAALVDLPAVALKIMMTGATAVDAEWVGVALSTMAGRAWYIPIRAAMGQTLPREEVVAALTPVLGAVDITTVGHDIKPAIVCLAEHGLEVRGPVFDTSVAAFMLWPLQASHAVARLCREQLGVTLMPLEEIVGKGRNQVGVGDVDPAQLIDFAGQQADYIWRLYELLNPQLDGASCAGLFADVEMPLLSVLAAMERRGVAIDQTCLADISDMLQARIDALRDEIHGLAGHPFNIESTRQLAEVLFDEQGLRVVRKTKTGRSTDADSLTTLAAETDHLLPERIIEYRELTKLKSTYTDNLPRMVSRRSGRIHATFHTTGAITGRLSSSDPNLQNIPIRTETGRQIRRAFVSGADEYVLLAADYSQIELRLLAHYCRDDSLIAAFERDEDIHQAVAAEVFGVEDGVVAPEQRARAKAVNFGIIYGQTPFGLAKGTGMTVGEASAFIDLYFMRYPGIRLFIDDCIERGKTEGYAETMLGRRRPLPELTSRNRQKRSLGERLAVNTVLQGSAADLIKKAMVDIQRVTARRDDIRMLIQVHDELVFECRRDVVDDASALVTHHMTTALPVSVPLKVDIGWGVNWLECKS